MPRSRFRFHRRTASGDTGAQSVSNRSCAPTLADVVRARLARRRFLRDTIAAAGACVLAPGGPSLWPGSAHADAARGRFDFPEIGHGADDRHHVAAGYDAEILIRWGDPVEAGAPPFDPWNQSADAQERQFGYNNDFIGYAPLPFGSASSDHALLCVNHEFTSEALMFPAAARRDRDDPAAVSRDQVEIEMAAHGASIVEVRRGGDGRWRVEAGGPLNRRISARSTPIRVAGPAAAHPRLVTAADPGGTLVIGTLNNCAGGMTPWGTYLLAEENFNGYFLGDAETHHEAARLKRYDAPRGWYAWGLHHGRFNVQAEANEINRFGWIVEIDPYDRRSRPVKRTALGRFKHEGAQCIVNGDGRVVVYSGDDERFEYVYRFVTEGRFDPADRDANRDLLDSGTLSVARFHDDGRLEWIPLVHGQGPLTAANGFASQADVLIDARLAADAVQATPMDRPEDVEPDPRTGRVYLMLTNNSKRGETEVNGPNARAANRWGQIVELTPDDGDHAAAGARWEILVQCGDPADPAAAATWNPATSADGWFSAPDNCVVDGRGRLWVATDQGGSWRAVSGSADGLWALETEGDLRATGRMFFRGPIGAEICGPAFNSDDTALFLSVQHPGLSGVRDYPGFERDSTFEDPATRWPDFDPRIPPRPAVVVITRRGGARIG